MEFRIENPQARIWARSTTVSLLLFCERTTSASRRSIRYKSNSGANDVLFGEGWHNARQNPSAGDGAWNLNNGTDFGGKPCLAHFMIRCFWWYLSLTLNFLLGFPTLTFSPWLSISFRRLLRVPSHPRSDSETLPLPDTSFSCIHFESRERLLSSHNFKRATQSNPIHDRLFMNPMIVFPNLWSLLCRLGESFFRRSLLKWGNKICHKR